MYKKNIVAGLILFVLPQILFSDWQVQRIDALKQDVAEAKISMNLSGEAAVAFTQNDTTQTPVRKLYVTLYDPISQAFTTPTIVDAGIDIPDIFGVGIDESGGVTIAFVHSSVTDSADYLFLNQYTPGSGWTGPFIIFTLPWPGDFNSLVYNDPKVGFLSTGAVVLFHYVDSSGTEMMEVYKEPGNFDVIDVTSSPSGQKRFVLSTNGTDRACIAYEIATNPTVRIYSSRFGYPSASWSSPELVDRDTLNGYENIKPSLSLGPDGTGFLVFGKNSTGIDTLFVNMLDTLSGWSGPVLIDSSAGDATQSWDVDCDNSGNAMVVYNKWITGLQGLGRYYQNGSGWFSPDTFTQGLNYSTNQKVSFDSMGNAGAIFNFGTQANPSFVGSNGYLPGTGWFLVDTIYGFLGALPRDIDIRAYGDMYAVAIFTYPEGSSRVLYAAVYTPTGIEESLYEKKSPFILTQNYPNPFYSSTMFQFAIPEVEEVKIDIYNSSGQIVRTLLNGTKPAGLYSMRWNGLDDNGKIVPPGVYFYQLRAGNFISRRKMLILR